MKKLGTLVTVLVGTLILSASTGSAGPDRLQDHDNGSSGDASWSADGRKVAFVRVTNGNYDIYTMNRDGKNQRRLTKAPRYDGSPSWSPSGRIAFASDRTGSTQIYTMKLDGSDVRQLTREGASYTPAWSRDGTAIAYARATGGEESQIYVARADGSGDRKITEGDVLAAYDPNWSPDGTRLLFTAENEDEESYIDVVGVDGSGRTRLTDTGADYYGSWSRDGRSIAVTTNHRGTEDVDLINADGTGRRPLIAGRRFNESSLVWSPDRRKIIFQSNLTDSTQLYLANTDGSKPKRLTGYPKAFTKEGVRCTIVGTPKADVLMGTSEQDVICGLGGDDTIRGAAGDDTIDGGSGSDRVTGGPGKDTVFGGVGADTLNTRDGVVDSVDGGRGADRAFSDRDDWVRNAESISYN